tara:strand:+ start:10 stop:777 length:768 start_codon:yes stop_codon:yes gene_type:complete
MTSNSSSNKNNDGHIAFRSGNPALSSKTFENIERTSDNVMTVDGTVNKVAISLILLLVSGYFTYTRELLPLAFVGAIGGLIVAIVTIFKKQWSPITVPIYSLLQGLFLGGISYIFNQLYDGIVLQAVLLTGSILFSLLFAYKSGLIKATENFKLGVTAATGGIFIVYMISFVMSFFGSGLPILDINNSSLMSIGFSLFVVVIASLNLVLDFDFIEQGAEMGAPKYMEWYGAFGLLVTLIWLYIEILRLLAKLRGR